MNEWVCLVLLTLEQQRHRTEDMRNEYLLHAGLPEKQMLKRRGARRTSVWECPGSVPTEGGGRTQRGQREPQHARNLGLGQLHRDIWSYSDAAELSQVETRELAFIPLCWSVDMGCPWKEVRPRTRQYSPGEAVPKGGRQLEVNFGRYSQQLVG